MSSGVWMSDLKGNQSLGDDQGVRVKFYGHEWEPATSEVPVTPDDVMQNMRLYGQGHARSREELPEAMAVWNEKKFRKAGQIFSIGFFVVRAKLADALSRFDLGSGGLIPFPVYREDLSTEYPESFYLLNFGAVKNTLRPEDCEDARKFLIRRTTGVQVWHVNDLKPGAKVVLSEDALSGPDLWFEEAAHNKIFMSDALAQEITELGLDRTFALHRCNVIGND